jgi:hypothetical protein
MLRICLSLVLLLTILIDTSSVAQQRKGAVTPARSGSLPRLSTSMRYPAVRAALIRAGWQPVPLAPKNSCGWDRCPPHPEVLSCGASVSWCQYAWRRGNEWLLVTAGGEDLTEGQWFELTTRCRSIRFFGPGPHCRP